MPALMWAQVKEENMAVVFEMFENKEKGWRGSCEQSLECGLCFNPVKWKCTVHRDAAELKRDKFKSIKGRVHVLQFDDLYFQLEGRCP